MSNNIFHNATSVIPNQRIYLDRPHIHDLLEACLQKPVTTIVAGAGYGKTQAVYDFLQRYDAITIWLQLSTLDNLPTRLWENFIYAVSLQNEELASNLISLGFPETMEVYYRFLDLLSGGMKRDERYVIVYDDCHLIYEKAALDFFMKCINARIPNLSIIFISRTEPDINTMGLLSKDLLSSITEDDLRFSENEMIQYFQMQNIKLSSKSILDIYSYTNGWIFAIHLVELSVKKGLIRENYALSVAKENISRLIETEIFSIVSEELQDFLVRLSLIDNLPLPLLKEIFPDSDILISEMSKISSFIRYDAFINTYRIHPLFFSFLCEKQYLLKTSVKRKIYIKAAQWYEKQGYKLDAISYYGKANDYDKIIDIFSFLPAFLSEEVAYSNFILEILETAPKKAYEKNVTLSLLYINLLINIRKMDEAATKLYELEAVYKALPDSYEKSDLLCSIYMLLGHISLITCIFTRKYDHEHFFKKAYEYMPVNRIVKRISLSIGPYTCRVGFPEKGEIEKFMEECKDPYGCRVNGCGYGGYELTCSEVAFFRNDLKNATAFAYKAIAITQEYGQYHMENMAWFYLIRINISTGQYSKVLNIINEFKIRVEEQNQPDSYTVFDSALGWFYSAINQTDKVASWIKNDLEDSSFSLPQGLFDQGLLLCANLFLMEDKYYEILVLLENNSNNLIKYYLFGQLELEILKAIALYYTNEHEAAIKTLQSAYNLAYPNCLEMPFIEHGKYMRTLAKAASHNKNCTIPKEWLEKICTKSSTYAKKLAHIASVFRMLNLLENDRPHLTKKELELLTDLCHGLTREEIADNCNLSINTVKTMLQNIYSKLGTVNTLDTVRIATLMKLIK